MTTRALPAALLLAALACPVGADLPADELSASEVPPPAQVAGAAQAQRARYLMGTLCTAAAELPDTARAGQALAAALDEIARLERVMSSWQEDSEVSRLNVSGGGLWFRCSRDLYAVLDSSLEIARLTGGAFDPTIEPLNRAWKMRDKGKLPSAFDIERTRLLVGWHKLSLDPSGRRAFLAFSNMGVDLGGIGKGYALDRAARLLRKSGIERALLNLGGEVLAIGDSCQVTVADPGDRLRPVVRLRISNAAISTSAQSERGVVIKRKRYGHIFDPRTGMPLEETGSVTVVAASATRADAFSTALLVMGREGAAAFLEKHPELGALWLEPGEGAVRAWRWNLPQAVAAGEAAIEWMDERMDESTEPEGEER